MFCEIITMNKRATSDSCYIKHNRRRQKYFGTGTTNLQTKWKTIMKKRHQIVKIVNFMYIQSINQLLEN